MSAAREYKDVVGELTAAAEVLRERDRARAAALRRDLTAIDVAREQVERRATLSRIAVELRWDDVLEALWKEQWMTLRPRPKPDPAADPDQLDALDREAEETAAEVLELTRRRFLGFGR